MVSALIGGNYKMTLDKRFIIDYNNDKCIRDILGVIEPIPLISSDQAIAVRDVLNANWEQFNKQKCLIQKLRNENKRLHRINGELHHRLGELND